MNVQLIQLVDGPAAGRLYAIPDRRPPRLINVAVLRPLQASYDAPDEYPPAYDVVTYRLISYGDVLEYSSEPTSTGVDGCRPGVDWPDAQVVTFE